MLVGEGEGLVWRRFAVDGGGVPEGKKTTTSIWGLRARFLPPEERGRRSGANGGFSCSRGGSGRRRCGGGVQLGLGHGGLAARVSVQGKRRGRRSKWPRGSSLCSKGGQGREGGAGRLGFVEGGKKGEEEEQHVEEGLLMLQGGPGKRGGARDRHDDAAAMARQ